MYKPLKKRSLSKYSGPLQKMIDKEVEKRMSALPKTEQEEYEEKKIDESTTEIKMGDGTFDRVTKSTFETVKPGSEKGGTGVSYKDAFDNLPIEEQKKFGSLENFVKESKSYWRKENPEVRETREEEQVESFRQKAPPAMTQYGNRGNWRITGEGEVISKSEAKIRKHNNPDLEILYPNKENAEKMGVNFDSIGTGFKLEDGTVLSEQQFAAKYNPNLVSEEGHPRFGRVNVRNVDNEAGSYEKFERPKHEKEGGEQPATQFKAQSHMLKGRSMSFRNKK